MPADPVQAGRGDPEKAARLREFLARHHGEVPAAHSSGTFKSILEEAGATVATALGDAGVDALVLKGPALDDMLYGEGESRRYVDIDVLVAPGRVHQAEHVLELLGYQNAGAHLGIDDVGGVVHADTWILLEPGMLAPQIELHRWIPGASAPADEVWPVLWSTRTRIALAGRRIWVLGVEGQAMQLAMHLAQHGSTFRRGAWELRLAFERWPPEVWHGAADLARRIGALEPFSTGLQLAGLSAALIEDLQLPSAGEMLWDAQHRYEFPRGIYFLEAIREETGLARLQVLRRALLPSPRWIAHNFRLSEPSIPRLAIAYARHLLRAPVWAVRAARFSRRRRSAVRGRASRAQS